MGRGLTDEQKSALNQLTEQLPADLIPGYSVATSGELDPKSIFLEGMRAYSKDLGKNAYVYYNFTKRKGQGHVRRRRTPKKILSAEGFPPWIAVSYAAPAPRSYTPVFNERQIKHFVFHSFGHIWMASLKNKKWVGWMNQKSQKKGVQAYEFEGRTVYVAKGSDPESLEHFRRFRAGLGSCLKFSSGVAPNFFIDRAGNLVVIGGCNDIQYASNSMDRKGISVELEEAFYVTDAIVGSNKKATFKPGRRVAGGPRGTAGNVEYFTYSPQQMLTLSILCKKMETAFPEIRNRHLSFADRTAAWRKTDPGYAMHDWIKGSHHFDISPNFQTQELWDAFFDLVDSHKHINPTNVFKTTQKYQDYSESFTTEPLAEDVLESMTDRMLQYARDRGFSSERANNIITTDKQKANADAGDAAAKKSLNVAQQVATTTNLAQQTQSPAVSLPSGTIPKGADGQQVGSSDIY